MAFKGRSLFLTRIGRNGYETKVQLIYEIEDLRLFHIILLISNSIL